MYDAKGQDVALTYYFQKAATDTWNVYATANGTPVGGTPAAPLPITRSPSRPTAARRPRRLAPVTLNIPASTNAAGAQTLPITGVQLDLTGATQYGSAFGVTDLLAGRLRRRAS